MADRLRRASLLVVLAAAQTVAVFLLYRLFVTTLTGRYVESASITGSRIVFDHIERLTDAVLNVVSVASVLAATALVVVVALLRRRVVLAAAVATMIVGSNVTTQVLKRYVLDRPDAQQVITGGVESVHNTLPSGHTTVALSVAVAFVLVVPARVRGLVAVLAAGYGTFTGVGTLSAQWHRPSDVVAAGLVVGTWAAGVGAVAVLVSRRRSRRGARRAWSLPLLAVLGVLLFAAGGLGLLMTARIEPAEIDRSGLLIAYVGGGLSIAGACCSLLAGVLAIAPWVVADESTPWRSRSPDAETSSQATSPA